MKRDTKRACVIAWGNDGRRDDGAGLALLERLGESAAIRDLDVQLEAHHQLGPEVASDLGAYHTVIFADAHVDPDLPPVFLETVKPVVVAALDSHHCSPATLLALCRALSWPTPACYQVGIRAYDCEFGDTLTSETSDLVDQAVQLVGDCLRIGDRASC